MYSEYVLKGITTFLRFLSGFISDLKYAFKTEYFGISPFIDIGSGVAGNNYLSAHVQVNKFYEIFLS